MSVAEQVGNALAHTGMVRSLGTSNVYFNWMALAQQALGPGPLVIAGAGPQTIIKEFSSQAVATWPYMQTPERRHARG